MNGLDDVDMNHQRYLLIGGGSTTADVLVELCRRRSKNPGEFEFVIHYRTPRAIVAYLASNCLPPGVFPAYSFFLRNRKFDHTMFDRLQNQELKAYRKSFFGKTDAPLLAAWKLISVASASHVNQHGTLKGATSSGAARVMEKPNHALMAHLLLTHPALGERLRFRQIQDRGDVQGNGGEPILDCTNSSTALTYDELDGVDADFRPDLRYLLIRRCLPACLIGQMATALGTLGQHEAGRVGNAVLDGSDARIANLQNYGSAGSQWDSVFLFCRYHSVSWLFVRLFHRSTLVAQVVAMLSYDFTTRLLNISGVSLLFFNAAFFQSGLYLPGIRGREIAICRWEWYNKETRMLCPFPVPEVKDFFAVYAQCALSFRLDVDTLQKTCFACLSYLFDRAALVLHLHFASNVGPVYSLTACGVFRKPNG